MSVERLRAALEGLDEVGWCSGTARCAERVALALPDGDVGAVDDAGFVKWLMAHAEPAPYGEGTQTKVNKQVRAASRLVARGAVAVHGFDVATVVPAIEAALSPTVHLRAELTDVVVYGKGGKFAKHKDTPRTADLVGTLVVGLPVAHGGGAFVVEDGGKRAVFDWSKPADALPWVALFSDVDHAIEPVTSGTRVTLVYALVRTGEPRRDPAAQARRATLAAACRRIALPKGTPLMIACGRRVIAEPDTPQPQPIGVLRGADRDIAEALVDAGYRVGVRACIAAVPDYEQRAAGVAPPAFPDLAEMWDITPLRKTVPAEILENMGDEVAAQDIEPYMMDGVPLDRWVIRKTAAATLVQEMGTWTATGYFGNEGFSAMLYTSRSRRGRPAGRRRRRSDRPRGPRGRPGPRGSLRRRRRRSRRRSDS